MSDAEIYLIEVVWASIRNSVRAKSERFPTFLHLWIRSNRGLSSKATGISIIQLRGGLLHKAASRSQWHETQLRAEAVWKRYDDAGFAIGTGQFRRGRASGGKSAYGHASE
jgi:hypothetical protein